MKRRNIVATIFPAAVLAIGITCTASGGFAETTNVPAVTAQPVPAEPAPKKVEPAQPVPPQPEPKKAEPAQSAQPILLKSAPAQPVPGESVPVEPVPAQPTPAEPVLVLTVSLAVPAPPMKLQIISQ